MLCLRSRVYTWTENSVSLYGFSEVTLSNFCSPLPTQGHIYLKSSSLSSSYSLSPSCFTHVIFYKFSYSFILTPLYISFKMCIKGTPINLPYILNLEQGSKASSHSVLVSHGTTITTIHTLVQFIPIPNQNTHPTDIHWELIMCSILGGSSAFLTKL